ncbi:MAG: hypothetical protein E7157_03155 [Lactobacillales bacterium]|nr:hypothetical protein [Lactobacillales bacterium]
MNKKNKIITVVMAIIAAGLMYGLIYNNLPKEIENKNLKDNKTNEKNNIKTEQKEESEENTKVEEKTEETPKKEVAVEDKFIKKQINSKYKDVKFVVGFMNLDNNDVTDYYSTNGLHEKLLKLFDSNDLKKAQIDDYIVPSFYDNAKLYFGIYDNEEEYAVLTGYGYIDLSQENLAIVKLDIDKKYPLNEKFVVNNDSIYWVGTGQYNILYKYNINTKKVTTVLTEKDNLTNDNFTLDKDNNIIYYIESVDENNIIIKSIKTNVTENKNVTEKLNLTKMLDHYEDGSLFAYENYVFGNHLNKKRLTYCKPMKKGCPFGVILSEDDNANLNIKFANYIKNNKLYFYDDEGDVHDIYSYDIKELEYKQEEEYILGF